MNFRRFLESDDRPRWEPAVVDTATATPDDEYKIRSAAIIEDGGTLKGWHVTSSMEKTIRFLESGESLLKMGEKYDEMGPGFYVSAIPHFWVGRATSKWDFLERLSDEERGRLADALEGHPNLTRPGYLTPGEKETALKVIRQWRTNPRAWILQVADQPYNISFWRPEFLRPLGISAGTKPQLLEVNFSGRFIECPGIVYDGKQEEWLRDGFDGAFMKQGFSTTGQLVILKRSSIIAYRPSDMRL